MVRTRTARTLTRRALTLLEVICAVIIVGVASPALLTAVRDATVRRASAQQQITARWLACEKLEDITADRHSASRGWAYIASVNYPDEPTVDGFTAFSRATTIAETGVDLSSAGTGYRRVTVTVTYVDAALGAKSFTIATVLTDYDQ